MQSTEEDSEFICHEPCDACGSSDGKGVYTDGHTYCFSCSKRTPATDDGASPTSNGKDINIDARYSPLPSRKITEETCKFWRYQVGSYQGKAVQVANYCDSSKQTASSKLRFADKSFTWSGKAKDALPLYGQWLWRDGGRIVVVTEGELDALSLSQVQGNKWPVVSLKNGASGAVKCLKDALEWLESYETIVLMFDEDEPGQVAAIECAQIFTPGKCKIASLPLKDASEMLVAGRVEELKNAVWNAKAYKPDGLRSFDEVLDNPSPEPEVGLPWFLDTMTEWTYGRRPGEVYTFGAGTGVGKTDFLTQQIAYDIGVLKERVGIIFLEQDNDETINRIAGKMVGKTLHIPNRHTEQERREARERLRGFGIVYDHWGTLDWSSIRSRIHFLAQTEGIKIIYLDHLTALADPAKERESIEILMREIAPLCKRLGVIMHLVSHLSTPDGDPHEEGGRVMLRHFKGSRSIGFWTYYAFGLERNTQDPDDQSVTLRCLKARLTGQATGNTLRLGYNPETGLIFEQPETVARSDPKSTGFSAIEDF